MVFSDDKHERGITIRTDYSKDTGKVKKYRISLEELISFTKHTSRLKSYYYVLKQVVKEHFVCCELCCKYRSVEVHHINKNRLDNRLENLNMLCKWCHIKVHKYMYNAKHVNKRT